MPASPPQNVDGLRCPSFGTFIGVHREDGDEEEAAKWVSEDEREGYEEKKLNLGGIMARNLLRYRICPSLPLRLTLLLFLANPRRHFAESGWVWVVSQEGLD